ncbi:hypothetical protein BSK67_14885 [Paenibacillus odorifer]|nr:hypothetical protein BSK67_14885 [Paenibacillus odorifer]
MISAYAIIMIYISVLTFIIVFLSRLFFRKNTTDALVKLIYVVLVLAIVGIVQLMLYGESNQNSLFIYSAIVIISIIILRASRKRVKK